MIIAVDFDGTIFDDRYPDIGDAIPGAIAAINDLYYAGFCIVINSCRVGEFEQDMVRWLDTQMVRYSQINKNCPALIRKYSGDTRKISATIYIDLEKDALVVFGIKASWREIYKAILKRYEGMLSTREITV